MFGQNKKIGQIRFIFCFLLFNKFLVTQKVLVIFSPISAINNIFNIERIITNSISFKSSVSLLNIDII